MSGFDLVAGSGEESDDAAFGAEGFIGVPEQFAAGISGRHGIVERGSLGFDHFEFGQQIADDANAIGDVFFIHDVAAAQFQGKGGYVADEQVEGERMNQFFGIDDGTEAGLTGKLFGQVIGGLVFGAGIAVEEGIRDGLDPVVVQVNDQRRTGLHDAIEDTMRNSLSQRSFGVAGERAIQVLPSDGNVAGNGFETDGIHEGKGMNRAVEEATFDFLKDFLDNHDAAHLVAMAAGGQPDHGTGIHADRGHKRQSAEGKVRTGENLEKGIADLHRRRLTGCFIFRHNSFFRIELSFPYSRVHF